MKHTTFDDLNYDIQTRIFDRLSLMDQARYGSINRKLRLIHRDFLHRKIRDTIITINDNVCNHVLVKRINLKSHLLNTEDIQITSINFTGWFYKQEGEYYIDKQYHMEGYFQKPNYKLYKQGEFKNNNHIGLATTKIIDVIENTIHYMKYSWVQSENVFTIIEFDTYFPIFLYEKNGNEIKKTTLGMNCPFKDLLETYPELVNVNSWDPIKKFIDVNLFKDHRIVLDVILVLFVNSINMGQLTTYYPELKPALLEYKKNPNSVKSLYDVVSKILLQEEIDEFIRNGVSNSSCFLHILDKSITSYCIKDHTLFNVQTEKPNSISYYYRNMTNLKTLRP